jgi:hypothetical protein
MSRLESRWAGWLLLLTLLTLLLQKLLFVPL